MEVTQEHFLECVAYCKTAIKASSEGCQLAIQALFDQFSLFKWQCNETKQSVWQQSCFNAFTKNVDIGQPLVYKIELFRSVPDDKSALIEIKSNLLRGSQDRKNWIWLKLEDREAVVHTRLGNTKNIWHRRFFCKVGVAVSARFRFIQWH